MDYPAPVRFILSGLERNFRMETDSPLSVNSGVLYVNLNL